MWDILCLIVVLLAFFRGWRKGVVVALCALPALLLGMLAALKFSGLLGSWMLEHGWVHTAWAQIISYALIFLLVVWLIWLLAKAVEGLLKLAFLGIISRVLGGLVYVFMASFILSCLFWVADHAHLIAPDTKAHARSYEWIAPLAPWVFAHLGAVLPFAKDIFNDLSQFFDRVNEQLSSHVGAA